MLGNTFDLLRYLQNFFRIINFVKFIKKYFGKFIKEYFGKFINKYFGKFIKKYFG